jgi:2,3-bisphosphoglycerate-independent phosphoglycerate mutase
MKYCIVIADGAADYPVAELGGKTPLQVAEKPNMDRMASEGLLGQVRTVPDRMEPGSDVAIMSIVGYDPTMDYTGRAPLEAVDMGVELEDDEWAFRCNFVTVEDGRLTDFSAGHISTEEAERLVDTLNEELGGDELRFYTGTGYRHLMIQKDRRDIIDVSTNPPHQVMGELLEDIWPQGFGSAKLVRLMESSQKLLANHDVNVKRRNKGHKTADMIWLWGQGRKPNMVPFEEKYGHKGAVISAVNLVRGIARIIGWEVVEVPGITAYLDTDYAAKGRYAIDKLSGTDLMVVHVEAPDEASHDGNVEGKVEAIEQIDEKIVGPIMEEVVSEFELRMLVLPDHYTSVKQGRHVRGPVPVAMWGHGINSRSGLRFSEGTAKDTELMWDDGPELMRSFLHV